MGYIIGEIHGTQKRVVFESTAIEDAQTTTLGGRCHFCSSASLHILVDADVSPVCDCTYWWYITVMIDL
jgi:hypothetical protein